MNALRLLACLLVAGSALSHAAAPGKPDALTPDGGRYYGPLRDGKLHGRGRLEWTNGKAYEGEFRDGYYWGRGDAVYSGGRKYRGEFVRGDWEGKGRHESADGEVHEGDFRKNEFTGRGSQTRKDGSRYEGEFVNWRYHGKGRYSDGRGTVYEGSFVNGELDGRGTVSGPGGLRYEGELKHWQFHGQGVLRLANGDVYKGGFAMGHYEGQGTLTYGKPRPDGATQQSGTWRYGALENREARRKSSLNVEAALYNQRALLDRAIASLKPRDPARVNLWLLAVAGDGSQEVFRREVEFVTRQFAERFGTAGRSLALVNSRSTAETAPMATATSLREALAALARRMDRGEDILFVFLTSHGSRSHDLVLNQNGMDLPDLPAAQLGRLLKESGVGWKVVLVSACYAGGFIDALKDDQTMVITAARHDRTSFGCADENEFTYFGRAFFKESLPRASSFEDAFRKAEVVVREMEAREGTSGDKHSLPQMWSAAPIERQLRRFWAQP